MLGKDELIQRLTAGGVEFELVEHEAANTVEAQVKALAASTPGQIIKNLFLKVTYDLTR